MIISQDEQEIINVYPVGEEDDSIHNGGFDASTLKSRLQRRNGRINRHLRIANNADFRRHDFERCMKLSCRHVAQPTISVARVKATDKPITLFFITLSSCVRFAAV